MDQKKEYTDYDKAQWLLGKILDGINDAMNEVQNTLDAQNHKIPYESLKHEYIVSDAYNDLEEIAKRIRIAKALLNKYKKSLK